MTKLPQTIKKTVNILTGEECQPNTHFNGRCSGRTTGVALSLLGKAMSSVHRNAFTVDHSGYSKHHADSLLNELSNIIGKSGLLGFKCSVKTPRQLRGIRGVTGFHCCEDEVFGVYVEWNQSQEVIYDLRK